MPSDKIKIVIKKICINFDMKITTILSCGIIFKPIEIFPSVCLNSYRYPFLNICFTPF